MFYYINDKFYKAGLYHMKYILKLALITLCILGLITGCSKKKATVNEVQQKKTIPQTYTITAPKAGIVIGLILEKGERISKEQPLFSIKDEALNKELDKLDTDIATSEAKLQVMKNGKPVDSGANIPTLQSRLKQTQDKSEKMQRLLNAGAISRKQAEAAQAELQQANSALAAAQLAATASKPASPKELEEETKKLEKLQDSRRLLWHKLQSNEVLCPATCIVKEVQERNGSVVKKGQTILILEETK